MNYHRVSGMTLLEVMLVLAISASLVLISLRVYRSLQANADIAEVQQNVNKLFNAMANYYRANCNGVNYISTFDKDCGASCTTSQKCTSKLDPRCTGYPTLAGAPVVIDIQTDLINTGFLQTVTGGSGTNPFGPNVIVSAYQVQFNQPTTQPSRSQALSPSGSATIGTNVQWQVQVAVQLRNSSKATAYLYSLGGDCASSAGAGGSVTACTSPAGTTGAYIVWQRLPSFSTMQSQSPFWPTMPTIQQFNQMYTTYPMTYLLTNTNAPPTQYFVCGS